MCVLLNNTGRILKTLTDLEGLTQLLTIPDKIRRETKLITNTHTPCDFMNKNESRITIMNMFIESIMICSS